MPHLPTPSFLPPVMLLALLCSPFFAGCAGRALPDSIDRGLLDETQVLADYGVDREWWKAYGDARLNTLITMALVRNVNLAKSAINVNRALYQAKLLGAELVPTFSSTGTAGSTSNPKTGDAVRSFAANLGVSYELDLWRRLRHAASARAWEYQATREDRDSARQVLINNVVDSYFNVIYLRQSMTVTSQSLKFYEKLYQIIVNRFQAGKVDGLELIMAEQSLLEARNSLTNLQTQIKTAEQTLRDLLDLTPDAPLPMDEINLLDVRPPSVDLNVPVAALGLRPDVRAAEYRIQKSFRNEAATRASLYPGITVGGSLNVSSNNADTLFDVPLLGGTIQINLPFLQWNKIKWNIKISEADFEEAKLNFTQTVTTALNEVDTYYFSYRNTLSLLNNMIKKHEADVKISAYRERRYQLGAGDLKNWLEARRTENESMIAVLKAKYDVLRYENAVFKALGGRLLKK